MNPIVHFGQWLQNAIEGGLREPNAMVVATVDSEGQPWSRYVLLKQADGAGFDFYTNYESNKSVDLSANPKASLTFGWLELHRQVMVAGDVLKVPTEECDEYWARFPKDLALVDQVFSTWQEDVAADDSCHHGSPSPPCVMTSAARNR